MRAPEPRSLEVIDASSPFSRFVLVSLAGDRVSVALHRSSMTAGSTEITDDGGVVVTSTFLGIFDATGRKFIWTEKPLCGWIIILKILHVERLIDPRTHPVTLLRIVD